jgi:hypothetical protein
MDEEEMVPFTLPDGQSGVLQRSQTPPDVLARLQAGQFGSVMPMKAPVVPVTPMLPNTGGASGAWEAPALDVDAVNRIKQTTPGAPAMVQQKEKSTSSTDLGAGARASVTDYATKKAEADKLSSDIDQKIREGTYEGLVSANNMIRARNDQVAADNVFANARIQEAQTRQDKKFEELSNFEIDGGRLFADGQTSNKIMAAIGLAMGAIGQGVTGKDFGVPKIIENAILRDIDVQKAQASKLGKEVELGRGMLSDLKGTVKDEALREEMAFAIGLEAVNKNIDKIIAGVKASDPAKAANLAEVRAQNAEKIMGIRTKANTVTSAEVVKDLAPKPKDPLASNNAAYDKYRTKEDSLKQLQELKDFSGKLGTGAVAGRWKELKSTFGFATGDEAKTMANLNRLRAEYQKMISGLTVSVPEAASLLKILPNLYDNPEAFRAKLDEIESSVRQSFETDRQGLSAAYTLPEPAVRGKPKYEITYAGDSEPDVKTIRSR